LLSLAHCLQILCLCHEGFGILVLWFGSWMPLRACVLKVLSSICGAIEKWWDLQEVGSCRRKLGHWGPALEGNMGTLAPPPLSLLPDCSHEVNKFLCHAAPPWCSHQRPTTTGSRDYGPNLCNCEPEYFSLIKFIVSSMLSQWQKAD
jgi:hypothetical protein